MQTVFSRSCVYVLRYIMTGVTRATIILTPMLGQRPSFISSENDLSSIFASFQCLALQQLQERSLAYNEFHCKCQMALDSHSNTTITTYSAYLLFRNTNNKVQGTLIRVIWSFWTCSSSAKLCFQVNVWWKQTVTGTRIDGILCSVGWGPFPDRLR